MAARDTINVAQLHRLVGTPEAPVIIDVMPPLLAGTLAGLLVTWVTFAPCFLWVILGAPFVEALRGVRALGAAFIWDADFLYGPRMPDGNDTYVLCEINVSSVMPIPDAAPAAIARLAKERLVLFSKK